MRGTVRGPRNEDNRRRFIPARAGNGASAGRFSDIEVFDLGAGDDALNLVTSPGFSGGPFTDDVTAFGREGNDVLWSGEGDDDLVGGSGVDFLAGGIGDDILTGGIAGGSGDGTADYLGFGDRAGAGTDVVTDFESGRDLLYFVGFGIDDVSDLLITYDPGNDRSTVFANSNSGHEGATVIVEGVDLTRRRPTDARRRRTYACVPRASPAPPPASSCVASCGFGPPRRPIGISSPHGPRDPAARFFREDVVWEAAPGTCRLLHPRALRRWTEDRRRLGGCRSHSGIIISGSFPTSTPSSPSTRLPRGCGPRSPTAYPRNLRRAGSRPSTPNVRRTRPKTLPPALLFGARPACSSGRRTWRRKPTSRRIPLCPPPSVA